MEATSQSEILAKIGDLINRLDAQSTQPTQPTQATAKAKEEKVTDADIEAWAARRHKQPVKPVQPTAKSLDADIEKWAEKHKGKTETNYIF